MAEQAGKAASSQGNSLPPGGGDQADISPAGQGKADFSTKAWSVSGQNNFSMSTYTKAGTLVEVTNLPTTFTMGRQRTEGAQFQLAETKSEKAVQVNFTTAGGQSQSYTVTNNTRFLELDDGSIVIDQNAKQDENKSIIAVNVRDEATVNGGMGNDVLFNFGHNVTLNGGEGNDVLFNMGNNVNLNGNAGDDLLKTVKDMFAPEHLQAGLDLGKELTEIVGLDAAQTVNMDGGEGNDQVRADVKLEKSRLTGGAGDDIFELGTVLNTRIEAGEGNDELTADTLYKAKVDMGEGDDRVRGTYAYGSTIEGGAGNDDITVDYVRDKSLLDGGEGADHIAVREALDSLIRGGAGDDTITVEKLTGSVLEGNAGDDDIYVGTSEGYSEIFADNSMKLHGSRISGGSGNDSIRVDQLSDTLVMGGSGDDTIIVKNILSGVLSGGSIIDGGKGNDSIIIDNANKALVMGGEGDDSIRMGTIRNSIVDPGGENDSLTTNSERNSLIFGQTSQQTPTESKGVIDTLESLGSLISVAQLDGATQQRYKQRIDEYMKWVGEKTK